MCKKIATCCRQRLDGATAEAEAGMAGARE